MKKIVSRLKERYVDPQYPFKDRLYFLFGTAGVMSAGSAFVAAIVSKLPTIAAFASLMSFFIMLMLMIVSFFMKDITIARVICAIFLNFFMFPSLFWVTGGVNCGMVFYFLLALCVATLILDGKIRTIILIVALSTDTICLCMGFQHPEWAYPLQYNERKMDTISSFVIVAIFIIAVILIMTLEYQKEHAVVLSYNEDLKQQVVTDQMTTLYNQSFSISTLEEQIAACRTGHATVSIAMFDIDGFKKVNDSYGHLRGNQVLCQFASILKEAAKDRYIATRYGGDEFLVVLPNSDLTQAFLFSEAVRCTVSEDQVLQALTNSEFSISGGVAQYQKTMSLNDLINLADTRLYAAKKGGRNKIMAS